MKIFLFYRVFTSWRPNASIRVRPLLKVLRFEQHLKTKIFFVTQYGYDTHSTQVDSSDNREGAHADLLRKLSVAISTFQLDLSKIEPIIAKIAISATLDAPFTFAALQRLEIELYAAGQLIASAVIDGQGKIIGYFNTSDRDAINQLRLKIKELL